MRIKVLFFIGLVFVMLQSCVKDSIQPTIIPVNTSVQFSTDVYPIFAKYSCTACHSLSGPAGSYVNLSGTASTVRTNLLVDAVVPGNSASSKLYTNFANGASHNGISLTATEIGNIKSWIDLGALNN